MNLDLNNYLQNSPEMQEWIAKGAALFPQQQVQPQQQPPPQILPQNQNQIVNIEEEQKKIQNQNPVEPPLQLSQNSSFIPERGEISPNSLAGINSQAIPIPRVHRTLQQALILKEAYQNNKDLYDATEKALPNLSGEKLEQAKKDLIVLQKNMNDAANSAEMLRNANPTLNFSDYGVGADNTIQQSSQAMANLNNRIGQSLYDANDDAYRQVQQVYDDARTRGIPSAIAESMALRKREELSQALRQRADEMFVNYGVNPDGSYNQLGLQLLGSMSRYDPKAAQFYSQALVSPKNAYDTSNNRINQLLTLGAAQDRQNAEIAYRQWSDVLRNGMAKYGIDTNAGVQMRGQDITDRANKMRYKLGLSAQEIEKLKLQQDNYFKTLEANRKQYKDWMETSDGKYLAAERLCRLLNIDPNSQEGQQFIKSETTNGRWGNDKSYLETVNLFQGDLQQMKEMFRSGDMDVLRKKIKKLRGDLFNHDSDFAKKFDNLQKLEVTEFLNLYDQAAEGKIGLIDFANKSYALEHPGWRPDPDEDSPWYLNMSDEEKKEFGERLAKGWNKNNPLPLNIFSSDNSKKSNENYHGYPTVPQNGGGIGNGYSY